MRAEQSRMYVRVSALARLGGKTEMKKDRDEEREVDSSSLGSRLQAMADEIM